MGGFLGFDYGALEFILRARSVPEESWAEVLETMNIVTGIAEKYTSEESKKAK